MKYRIVAGDELSRSEKRYRIARWIVFALMLLVFYVIMRAGIFGLWQPVFIIPLAVAVSMYESELSSCVFALFCGFMIDIAYGTLFGFSSVWLMGICVMTALLVRNLIRVNIINFCILSAAAVLIEFSMYYLFNIFIWNVHHGEIILTSSLIPTVIASVIVSPAVYWLVKFVEGRLRKDNADVAYYDGVQADDGKQGEKS